MSMSVPVYYPVWVSSSGRKSLRWGPLCETPAEARNLCRAELAAGTATLGFVAGFSGGRKSILHSYTVPESARKIVLHLLAVEDALDNPPV